MVLFVWVRRKGTKAFARKPASVREMIGVRNLFNKKGRVLRMMNPTIVVVTDHAANAGVQDRQICNNSEIETMRIELEQHRPWMLAYSQGDSPILDLADAASNKGAGAITSFCGACIGGIAHKRWCQVENTRLGQTRHVRNLMMGMACATNYGVNSTW